MVEGCWYALEWNLSRARTLEGVHKAFAIAAFKPDPGPLEPLLRESFEPASIKQLEKTREELGKAYQRSRSTQDNYQAQLLASNDAERVASSVTEDAEKNIRQELQRRAANLSTVLEGMQAIRRLIQDQEFWHKTRAIPGERSSEVVAWNDLLSRLERHRQGDEPICAVLAAQLRAITPEVRQIAGENTARQKSLLISAERKQNEAYQYDQALAVKRQRQEAFIYRSEVLKFLRAKEYRLSPLTLANAIAGLPYISARRSAQLCAKTETQLTHSGSYEIFQLVKRAWKRCRRRSCSSMFDKFETEIRRLPKFRIVEGHKQPYWLRAELATDWYYLKKTLQDPELAKLHPGAIPGAIVATFLRKRSNPESPVTPTIAESERIKD
jgi:hypothetical protein